MDELACEYLDVAPLGIYRPMIVAQGMKDLTQMEIRSGLEADVPEGRGEEQGALAGLKGSVVIPHLPEMVGQKRGDPHQPPLIVQGLGERFSFAQGVEHALAFSERLIALRNQAGGRWPQNHRLIPNAIEPRASMASYNSATGELTLWVTTQNPHVHRLLMAAFVLGMPEHKVRVISGDVGGGFGSKIFLYPEEVTVSWASKQLGRPVKGTAERRESFMTDATAGTTSPGRRWRSTGTARSSRRLRVHTRTRTSAAYPSRQCSRR